MKHPIPIRGLRCPKVVPPMDQITLNELGQASALIECEKALLMRTDDEEPEVIDTPNLRKTW